MVLFVQCDFNYPFSVERKQLAVYTIQEVTKVIISSRSLNHAKLRYKMSYVLITGSHQAVQMKSVTNNEQTAKRYDGQKVNAQSLSDQRDRRNIV